jgi:inorganic pyrophosphatase
MKFPPPFYRWRPHPWHGLDVGPNVPSVVHAYIELTPFDRIKYELDKQTGYLRVDRPNRTSSFCPTLYGFVPRTYCGDRVAALMPEAKAGDHDPLDICVISERPITMSEIILKARIVGGLPMCDVSQLPKVMVDRLRHYFSTYKMLSPDDAKVNIDEAYGREHAEAVVKAAMADYLDHFGE